ncbi:uncharacterized protein LOC144705799 [Wolffia australiana]
MAASGNLLRLPLSPNSLQSRRQLCPHTSSVLPANFFSHKLHRSSLRRRPVPVPVLRVFSSAAVEGGGVSLGTMKLPPKTDLARFEILLFQWANSLCQGASLPLSTPLKVDRVKGGARLGFVSMGGDGDVDVPVYIDCVVVVEADGPMFRAVRNGPQNDRVPPDEPRIMRSLLQALVTSVQIATAS